MSLPTPPATAAPGAVPVNTLTGTAPAGPRSRAKRRPIPGLLPFGIFMALFLGVPVFGIVSSSLQVADPGNPGEYLFGFEHFTSSFQGAPGAAMQSSLTISLTAALIGGVAGLALAQAILHTRSVRLNRLVTVLTSVLANSGGVPLAFSFIATLGNAGIVTAMLSLTDVGFNLYSSGGLILMYQYFLVPTMVMVVLPTLAGLRKEWKESASSLGANGWYFWKKVALPISLPAILSGFVLLFGASFATHASAAALIGSGGVPLVTLQIAGGLSGGNLAGQENIAMALSANMIAVAAAVLLVYMPLQKRSLKWFK